MVLETSTSPEDSHRAEAFRLYREGWAAYNQRDYARALEYFNRAVSLETSDPDYHYALALAQKFHGLRDQAIQTFQRVIDLTHTLDDQTRSMMIRRLAKGHINHMTAGSWNLEKELWKRSK